MRDLTVLTNGPDTFRALQEHPGITALLTGGELDTRTGSLVGPLAARAARDVMLRRLFVSAAAVDPDLGSSESTLEEAEVKIALAGSAAEVVLAVTASKLGAPCARPRLRLRPGRRARDRARAHRSPARPVPGPRRDPLTDDDTEDLMTAPTIARLTVEHRTDALGMGVATPRLSWCTATDVAGWTQAAYELRITATDGVESSTGLVELRLSPCSCPGRRRRWRRVKCRTVRVRVVGGDGSESPWSEPLVVEAGLLDADDWQATFVGPAWDEDLETPQPCPYLRRSFTIPARGHAGAGST